MTGFSILMSLEKRAGASQDSNTGTMPSKCTALWVEDAIHKSRSSSASCCIRSNSKIEPVVGSHCSHTTTAVPSWRLIAIAPRVERSIIMSSFSWLFLSDHGTKLGHGNDMSPCSYHVLYDGSC